MKILRFDSIGGASGDMILGALIGLGVDVDVVYSQLKTVIPEDEFEIVTENVMEQGISGVRTKVILSSSKKTEHHHAEKHLTHHHHKHPEKHSHEGHHSHHHHDEHQMHSYHHHAPHRTFADIEKMIQNSSLNSNAQEIACTIFKKLAIAEGNVHGKDYKEVHFHEVGAVDSIVDIVGIAIAYDILEIEKIMVSTLPIGHGVVKCEHGLMPIPAPATAELLKGFECIFTNEPFELVTPTGAAVLTSLPSVDKEARLPAKQRVIKNINSFGHRQLNERINMLRVMLSDSENEKEHKKKYKSDSVYKLSCNIDDMTPEHLGHVQNKLLALGALDVYCENILMKKQRLAVKLTLLCQTQDKEKFLEHIFYETTSLGTRIEFIERAILERKEHVKKTVLGNVNCKQSFMDDAKITEKIEFDDLEYLAQKNNLSVKELKDKIYDLLDEK